MAVDPGAFLFPAVTPEWEPFRRIGTVANRAIPHVSPWLAAPSAAAAIRAVGASEALVVDGDGTPLGVVTAAQLDAMPGAPIGETMTTIGAVLHESVPLSVAASLMASLRADRIAVVSDGRRAIGVLTSAELRRWSAASGWGS